MAVIPSTDTTPRVSHLALEVQRALRAVGSGWVEGEVQRLRRASSGHIYFSLADEDSTVECCVWHSAAARISQWPREGTLVQAHYAKVDFYGRSGRLSLHVDALRLTGDGELLARKRAVLHRLAADGLVARARRPLPVFPRRVGVIAARDSDAKTDVVTALRERWPSVHIVHRAALAEGVRAVDSIIEALGQLQDIDAVDVIVLARGGGGVRDLVAFDDERLCRAVFACAVPVVTSIGHTAQRPNCDHVAAAHADVPARTAELVVPSAHELAADLDRAVSALDRVPARIDDAARGVAETGARARPVVALRRRELELEGLGARLGHTAAGFFPDRVAVVRDAGNRLIRARSRLPVAAMLDLPAQQLGAAAARMLAHHIHALDGHDKALVLSRWRVPGPGDVDGVLSRLLAASARVRRRWEADRRGLSEASKAADRAFARRLRDVERDVTAVGRDMGLTARRRLEQAQRGADHIAAVIAARDFRRSGWVLAGDARGAPVRSATDLAPGDDLSLRFHDGVADAVVSDVHALGGDGHD